MNNLVELSGRFFVNGEQVPFEVVIHTPVQIESSGDYFCRVLSQQLFTRTMDVYGVSRNQAVRLAINLVKEALAGRLITEEDAIDDLGCDGPANL